MNPVSTTIAEQGRVPCLQRRPRAGAASPLLTLLFIGLVVIPFLIIATGRPKTATVAEAVRSGAAPTSPTRIVSLVPSLTETLLLLGLKDRLVGITDFCDHLPEARQIPSIGSVLEPGIEAVAARAPDLILYGPDQERSARRLSDLGFRTMAIRQISLEDIPSAITRIGDLCGMEAAAASATERFRRRLEAVARAGAGRHRPRVLLVVGRDTSGGKVDQAYVAAPGAYHDELLRAAGGDNAWRGPAPNPYPVITREGLMSLNPDLIIDLVPDPERQPGGLEGLRAAWKAVPGIPAIVSDRIHLLTEKHLSIPGPESAADAAERLARVLHPEALSAADAEPTPPAHEGADAPSLAGLPQKGRSEVRREGEPHPENMHATPVSRMENGAPAISAAEGSNGRP